MLHGEDGDDDRHDDRMAKTKSALLVGEGELRTTAHEVDIDDARGEHWPFVRERLHRLFCICACGSPIYSVSPVVTRLLPRSPSLPSLCDFTVQDVFLILFTAPVTRL